MSHPEIVGSTAFSMLRYMTRAWALQERFLSRRIVHFGQEQILWECCEEMACESYPGVVFENLIIYPGTTMRILDYLSLASVKEQCHEYSERMRRSSRYSNHLREPWRCKPSSSYSLWRGCLPNSISQNRSNHFIGPFLDFFGVLDLSNISFFADELSF